MTRKQALVRGSIAVALVAVYALAGFVGVPRLVHGKVVELFATDYQRTATLGDVHFNPFTFEFEAHDLAVPDADDTTRMLGFERLYVNFELSSLWHRAWTFRQIDLEAPYLRVVQRADGTLNLLDLVPSDDGQEPESAETEGLPALRITELDVVAGRVDVADQERTRTFETTLAPVTFRLDDFRTAGTGNAFAFTAGSDRAGHLAIEGSFGVEPLASQGSVTLSGLHATTISEYLGTLLPVALLEGTIDLGFNYDFRLEGDPFHFVLDLPNVAVRGLKTQAPGYDVPWRLQSIDLRNTHVDLAAGTIMVQAIDVREVSAPMWLDKDGFHAPGVVGRAATAATTPGETSAEPSSWTVSIPTLTFASIGIPLEDRSLAQPARLDLTVETAEISGLALPMTGPLQVTTRVTSGAGGTLSASGTLNLEPLEADMTLEVADLDLTPVQPYLAGDTDLLFESGRLSADGKASLSGLEPLDLKFDGNVAVADLLTRDRPLKEDFIRWTSLEASGIRYTSQPARLDIREVVAREPYLRLILAESGVTNIESVLDPQAAAAKAAALAAERAGDKPEAARQDDDAPVSGEAGETDGGPALAISIANTRIAAGNVNFADYTIRPNFQIAMEDLNGFIKGSSSDPQSRSTLELDGQVDRYAPVHIAGQLNLLAPMAYIDIEAFFRNIDLTRFNPYSTKFIGYQIAQGKLFIDTRYKVEESQLDAVHQIKLDQLEFGEKIDSPDAIGLPIKLAVALLKDSKGVIDLELPVSGSVDDPRFRLGPIIWKAFVGLLTKIVTAPFALLGNLFGGGEDLSYVDFAAGSADLDAGAQEKVAMLRKALAERPVLKLQIPWTAVAALDGPAIERASWEAAIGAAGGTPGETWKTDRQDYLRRLQALYEQVNGGKPVLEKPPKPAEGEAKPDPIEFAIAQLEPGLQAGYAAEDAAIDALAEARAVAVRDALLGEEGLQAERVFISRGEPQAAEGDAVRMTLSLE